MWVERRQLSVLATENMSVVEAGQMSSVPQISGSAWSCGAFEVARAGV